MRSNKDNITESFREISAIALGIEVRYDLLFNWSERLIQETADIAAKVHIPEEAIGK